MYQTNVEYQTTNAGYNEYRGDLLYDILVYGKKYQVKVDETGRPQGIRRYNQAYRMYIDINFSKEIEESAKKEVQHILQSQYINRIASYKGDGQNE